jgi:hypothetical protein
VNGEKIEVFRLAMAEPERKRGPTVENELLWRSLQFKPKAPLRLRENGQIWFEHWPILTPSDGPTTCVNLFDRVETTAIALRQSYSA